jgi:type II secretory pathway pseudopilin PulG
MRIYERGDTIIEVLFAITVFSLVAVGALSVMNQGTALAQRALEIGLVRQQIDAQTDALHYLNSAYIEDFHKSTSGATLGAASKVWKAVVTDNKQPSGVDFDTVNVGGCHLPQGSTDHPFALDLAKIKDALSSDSATSSNGLAGLVLSPQRGTMDTNPATYARIESDIPGSPTAARGIWIEAVQNSPTNTGFYDFHITACWTSPGQETPVKLGTIVRLYEPQG